MKNKIIQTYGKDFFKINNIKQNKPNMKRNQKILSRLARIWKQFPYLRLGQLIQNPFDKDFYYMSDEEFIAAIEDYYEIDVNKNE